MPDRDNNTPEGRTPEPLDLSPTSQREHDTRTVFVNATDLRKLRDDLLSLADCPDLDVADLMGRVLSMASVLPRIQDEARPSLDGVNNAQDRASLVEVDAARLDLAREDLQSLPLFAYEKGLARGKGALRELAQELTDLLGQ